MFDSSENCDKKPLIALWFLHKTTNEIPNTDGEEQAHLLRLQRHWLFMCHKYGVTVDQVADSLEVSLPVARELWAMADEFSS